MLKILAVLIIVAGILGGLYLGLWVCLVGGIVQIIDTIQHTPVEARTVAIGVLRVLCTGLVTWLTILLSTFIGGLCFAVDEERSWRWRW